MWSMQLSILMYPTFRSFNQRDDRFSRRAALRDAKSTDEWVAGVRRGRAKLRKSVHGATQCPRNIERREPHRRARCRLVHLIGNSLLGLTQAGSQPKFG